MRPHVIIGAASLCAAVAATSMLFAQTQSPAQTPPAGQPVFRTSTDLVSVDVGVKSGGAPVASLTAADFVLLDNGVPQHIESIDVEQVPVDITILVDTNGTLASNVDALNNDLKKITAFVRPGDQLRVMQIDTYVTDLLPLQQASKQPPLGRLQGGGLSSANDGLAAALMRANPDRPNLIVAITDSIDAVSTLSSEAVRDIAKQSSATLHISWVTMSEKITPLVKSGMAGPPPYWESAHEKLVPFQCAMAGLCQSSHRAWLPYSVPAGSAREKGDFANLREATASTGGAIHAPGIFAERTAAAVFQKVFEDYRRTYLLRYTPKGVPPTGWHDIVVKIPAHVGYEIHARRGYAIDTSSETGTAIASAGVAPFNASRAPTLSGLLTAYGKGEYLDAENAFRNISDHAKLIRDFRAGGNPWPATPRREASLVLELADAVVADHRDDVREAGRSLLSWYSKLVRPAFGPDSFERDWRWAELAILEGAMRPTMAKSFVADALTRFPDEPRFVLARAIVADQAWPIGSNAMGGGPSVSQINDVIADYDAAIAHPETAFEGRVRQAWFLHRIGLHDKAIALLDEAGDQSPDAVMRYLRHLFRGEALDASGHLDDAIASYRQALAIRPDASSGRVALMNALVKKGERDEAHLLAESLQTVPTGDADPWWVYWQGDYRLYSVAITRVRAQVALEPYR